MADDPVGSTVPDALSVPRLTAYALHPNPPRIVPADQSRAWMDATEQRFAYRCIPLSIANASGWEILCPVAFQATWFGGTGKDTISITPLGDRDEVSRLVSSHFGAGVLTFQVGYLFRTSPGWALLARGLPNTDKRGLTPLEGLIETDWLDFAFTMNWRFTRSGTIQFEEGEPFCFITPVPHVLLDQIQPDIRSIDDDPALKAAYTERAQSRRMFIKDLNAREPEAVAQGWQRHYVRGEAVSGPTSQYHLSRRKLKPPITSGS